MHGISIKTLIAIIVPEYGFPVFRKLHTGYATENNDYQTDLAITLGTLAVINDQVGDYSEALKAADRALDYWHTGEESARLANPQTYQCASLV
jgi:uncharacterized protein HemY